jgi:hypothetical protein
VASRIACRQFSAPEENLTMKTTASRIGCLALLALLLASCTVPPAPSRSQRTYALIMSGDVVSYGSTGAGTRISVSQVDGKPPAEPYGPIELAPGRHTLMLACDGEGKSHALNVAAGEVYLFSLQTTPGVKGCTGALSRLRPAKS